MKQETLERCLASFEAIGFEISPMGGREVRVDAVPDNLFSLSGRELFLEMLDELGEEKVTAPTMIDEKVALMSCKAAVKGNDVLAHEEAEARHRTGRTDRRRKDGAFAEAGAGAGCRDHQRGFDAGLPGHGYRECEAPGKRQAGHPALSAGCERPLGKL